MNPMLNTDHQRVRFSVSPTRASMSSGNEDASAEQLLAPLKNNDFDPGGSWAADRWANLGSMGAWANQAMRVG
jgi:hypothetical protein